MRQQVLCMGVMAGLLISTVARAEDGAVSVDTGSVSGEDAGDVKEGGAVLLGAKAGGIVPFGGLGPFVTFGVEGGYVFPWMNRSFAAALYVDYTAPSQSGTKSDARLGEVGSNTSYDWELRQQELAFMPVFLFRITSLGRLTPYGGIGPRIYLLRSKANGSAGDSPIGVTTEQSTKVGVGVPLGLEYELGPGGLLAEVLLQYGGLDHEITGDSNTGALSLSLGYRFLL